MPDWTEPFASFSSMTLTFSGSGWSAFQYGSVVDYEHVMDSHAVQWLATLAAPPGDASLALQGSLDGTTYYDLGDIIIQSGQPDPTPALLVASVRPARYVRAAVAFVNSGSITVTALLIAHD